MSSDLDKHFLVENLKKLVGINSVNPGLVSGAPGEKEIAQFIAKTLSEINIENEIEEIEPGRFNVYGIINGRKKGPSLTINMHTDTVGTENMEAPFSAAITDGRLYGRGAQDMKGSIAAALTMAKALVEQNIELNGDLILAFVADEEYGSIGTECMLEKYQTDAAIVAEPTDLDICIAHKGFGLFKFITKGKAAHGAQPEIGIDANMHMGRIMTELEKYSRKLKQNDPHPLLGHPSLHIPVIRGGSEPFTYADTCSMQLEKRTLPGESLDEVLSEFQSIIARLSERDERFNAAVESILWREPYETDKTKKIVTTLFDSVKNITGAAPSYIGHPWWEDSGLIGKEGIDTVIIGPKGGGLHSKEEWVDIESVFDLSGIFFKTVTNFLNVR